jgi:hypothetical protein
MFCFSRCDCHKSFPPSVCLRDALTASAKKSTYEKSASSDKPTTRLEIHQQTDLIVTQVDAPHALQTF